MEFVSIISSNEIIEITKKISTNSSDQPAGYCIQKDLDWNK